MLKDVCFYAADWQTSYSIVALLQTEPYETSFG